jgi:hypothetical protein
MMCDFVSRTNWLKIESNYFVDTVIIFDLSYYTNITITVLFVKQAMLCRAFSFVSRENYPHKSCAIFHTNLYVFNIRSEIPNSTNKLNHVKQPAVFQNKPFWIPYSRMNHLFRDWNKHMLTIIWNTLCNRCAWWLPLVNKRFVINKLVAVSIIFFRLGVINDAAKPDCVVPTGDNGSLYEGRSSGELIVININTESECNSNLQIGMALSIK